MGIVTIGGDTRPLQDADSQLVTQEINGRRHAGELSHYGGRIVRDRR